MAAPGGRVALWPPPGNSVCGVQPDCGTGALFSLAEIFTANRSSFDVQFGYTGAYTAGAHGLIPATVTNATVVQDPDQEFDPNDGFSNAHTFNLSGVAFFRLAIPPEATEVEADLDVYVFDPNGDLVASSTAGGTEEVDISLPADSWTVYAGWQTSVHSAEHGRAFTGNW
jgi:hypothetical protein